MAAFFGDEQEPDAMWVRVLLFPRRANKGEQRLILMANVMASIISWAGSSRAAEGPRLAVAIAVLKVLPEKSSPIRRLPKESAPSGRGPRRHRPLRQAVITGTIHLRRPPRQAPRTRTWPIVSSFWREAVKIHECSICGSEFGSGQALGGHMRKHRAASNNGNANKSVGDCESSVDEVGGRAGNVAAVDFDLNLPAPEEEEDHGGADFDGRFQRPRLVFSAAALVGCHY
ncbi:Zinc finger protein ZAT5 [Striga hermonthica]|uniref:Zinc finger protein ZAT5 n=1 Tax=Striga hermonthica TaxID=68872 RepID=A0A9N7RIY3_STRHE|nr:Zinc finger protein ZAT5 [Striga hermonthica]